MTISRTPFFLGLVAFGLIAGLVLILQPYSVTSPWSRFDEPGRRYLAAALRRDTVALVHLSGSSAAVQWALKAEERERVALTSWVNSVAASVGFQRGDTTDVLFGTATRACPLLLTFVNQNHPVVLRAHVRCYMRRGWPTDPSVIAVTH
jgi:hypothetical protein